MQLISIADLLRADEELNPLIKVAQTLGDVYRDFIRQDDEPYSYTVAEFGEKERSSGIHASEMSDCLLKMVYSLYGLERRPNAEDMDANMKMRFRTGTSIHGMLQSDFKRMAEWYTIHNYVKGDALTFDKELAIKPDLQEVARYWELSSHCDGVFTFWRNRRDMPPSFGYQWDPYLRLGVEIKTSSAAQYEERKKPELKHLEQTCLYQACLDLPLMWVIYYNKSNSNFTTPYPPWLFKFDQARWEKDLQPRFAKAHLHKRDGTLPDRTEGKHCSWCPFNYHCKPPKLNRSTYGTPVVSAGMMVRRNQ